MSGSAATSVRAFLGRFLIALVVGSLLMAGAVAGVDREVGRKLDRIPKIELATAPLPPDGANYLIIGSDSREFVTNELEERAFGTSEDEEGRRSDTIMVLHLEPRAERTLIVSFPRDLWVNIPEHGMAKINAAYNYGPQTVIDTLKANFDIDVNHYVEMNFPAFVGLVDTLGGVDVYVPHPARDEFTGLDLENGGCRSLDGEQSLQWVRSRSLELYDASRSRWVSADIIPDIARIGRQQDFLRRLAGVAVAKSLANPFTANSVADEFVDHLKVDEGLDDDAIFSLIKAFRTLNPADTSALEFHTLPWKPGGIIQGQDVLLPDLTGAEPLVERLRTFDTKAKPKPAPGTISIRIVNGSGRPGLGVAAQQQLEALGFVVAEVWDDAGQVPDTSVRFNQGQADKAKLLLRYFEPQAALDSGPFPVLGADLELVLGRSFAAIVVPADHPDPTVTTAPVDPGAVLVPPDPALIAPLEEPPASPTVDIPNPAPRGDC